MFPWGVGRFSRCGKSRWPARETRRGWVTSWRKRLVLQQEIFVEGSKGAVGVDDGDLEHPQVRVGAELDLGQRPVVVGRVGEVRKSMTREVEVQLPAVARRRFDGVVVELLAGRAVCEPLVAHLIPDEPDLALG